MTLRAVLANCTALLAIALPQAASIRAEDAITGEQPQVMVALQVVELSHSKMEIRLPRGYHDGVQLRRRPRAVGGLRLVLSSDL